MVLASPATPSSTFVDMESRISVFQYSDFQVFLRDWFEQAKRSRRGTTLQAVAAKLGLKSRSHLHRILYDSHPPFSGALVPKLAEVLALSPREAEYFTALVDFHRAETLTQKNQAYRRMHAMLALRDPSPLKPDRFAYFSDWVLPALREVAVFPQLRGNAEAMSECFEPRLGVDQVQRGLKVLEELGMLKKNGEGKWEQADSVVDTGDDLMSLAIYNFQMETLELARKALEQLDRSNREISTLTFSIPAKSFETVRQAMRKARDEIVRTILEQGDICDQVFHLNLQCFPLTKKGGK